MTTAIAAAAIGILLAFKLLVRAPAARSAGKTHE
jgi:hypothetical protein